MPDSLSAAIGAQSSALLLQCIDFITDTLLVTEAEPIDLPGPRVVFVNQAFERMTGYAASEILGQTPRLLQGAGTDRAELDRIRSELAQWRPIRAELVNYKKSGEAFFVEMDIVPIGDANGRWTHWVSIQRDVTARKKSEAEARAREAQRYESLGTLSSGIAHDFNNIIAAILGNVANGTLDMQSGRMPLASMEQIRKAALRARSVVAKILAYARRRAEVTVPVQLAPVVREATDLLRAVVPADVRLEVICTTEPVWVRGDTSQLCQVLLNLGVNALQALERGERLIRFTLGVADRPANGLPTATGRVASIRVADTGCGMDAATRARIFEPYFTTKEDGRGTGLGLSVVWGVVTAHGGAIAVTSEVGRGTTIELSLPLIDQEADIPPPLPEPPPAAAIGRGERVMVVDDDEVVVVMLEGMLKRWGFRVTALQDPLKAVSLLKSAPDAFDAVVTDLNMPNVSGLQLARELLAIRRDMPVLLGSGTVSEELVDEAAQVGIAAVFPKEFAVEQLGSLLQGTLARSPRLMAAASTDASSEADFPDEARMHRFLTNNRDDLVVRCAAKVAKRSRREATSGQLENGVPLFLDQLIRTLTAEEAGDVEEGVEVSGPSGGDAGDLSDIGAGAVAHGRQLLALGYSIDQVVHDYGDLCQAITDLATERDAPFSIASYRTLNRCLDNAIADAVTAFAALRDAAVHAARKTEENERLGFLAHELRNYLQVAVLAFDALENGTLPIAGATGRILKRNLHALDGLIDQTLSEVRQVARPDTPDTPDTVFSLAAFVAEAASIASFHADASGCTLTVPAVDPRLAIAGARESLIAALGNLLQNALKYTRPRTEVTLAARAEGDRVLIEVRDHCGGLPPGVESRLFRPFALIGGNAQGLGLGLSIAAKSVGASGGVLSVRNIGGEGCVFTIDLPARSMPKG